MKGNTLTQTKVSIIITTYNRSVALLAVLRSLAQQCTVLDEVIIADDGSRDEEVQALYKNLPKFKCCVKHVWQPDVGFTAARVRNLGAKVASGDYLIFLDGDCVPNRNFIARHRSLMEGKFFLQGSRIYLTEKFTIDTLKNKHNIHNYSFLHWAKNSLTGNCNRFFCLIGTELYMAKVVDFLFSAFAMRYRSKRGAQSCNMAIWSRDYERVNGFDEVFEGYGYQDFDLELRLRNLGYQRKMGSWGTEVFHLYHKLSSHKQVDQNRPLYENRINSGITFAEKGLLDTSLDEPIQVKIINEVNNGRS